MATRSTTEHDNTTTEYDTAKEQYTLNVLPESAKSRAHKLAYCRRLARNLANFDNYPWLWGVGEFPDKPPILDLPNELLQNILEDVIDDDDLSFSADSYTKTLRAVCKEFTEQMVEVRKKWDRRLARQAAGYALSRASINLFIEDTNTARACRAEALKLRKVALMGKGGQKIKKHSRNGGMSRNEQKKLQAAHQKAEVVVDQVQSRTKIKFNNRQMKYRGNRIKFD